MFNAPRRNWYNKGFQTRPAQAPTQTWSADQVWAAAAYAQRINGSYLKEDRVEFINDQPTVVSCSSKALLREALEKPELVTVADTELGQQAREWHKKTLLFKALKTSLNEFESNVARVSALDSFDNTQRLELAITASQIQSFITNSRVEQAMSRVDTSAGFLGAVGSKVSCQVEVIRSIFSVKYNCTFITAITSKNQSVFFSYRSALAVGAVVNLSGTVKAHRDNTTQLSRVKIYE